LKKLAAHYKPHFILYSLGFERLYPQIYENIRLKGMFMFFLDVAKAVRISFSENEFNEYIRYLSSIMDYAESHDDMEDYREKPSCDHNCEFANLCRIEKLI